MTVEIGIANRGKYTFVSRLALCTKLLEAWVSPFEKNIQGTSAVNAKSGYGTPSDGTFANRPKNSAKTAMVMIGWMIAQIAPSAVCL